MLAEYDMVALQSIMRNNPHILARFIKQLVDENQLSIRYPDMAKGLETSINIDVTTNMSTIVLTVQ